MANAGFVATMPGMWKRAAVVLVVAVQLTSCTVYSKPANGWAGATGGEKIEQLFWDDVKAKDVRNVDAHIASTFVGNGPTGAYDRAAFLEQLKTAPAVTLSECASHLNGEDLMITCTMQREAARVSSLSVWQQYKKGWLMVAHAEASIGH